MCVCASIRPGRTVAPPRSSIDVCGVASRSTAAGGPTATIRSPGNRDRFGDGEFRVRRDEAPVDEDAVNAAPRQNGVVAIGSRLPLLLD